MVKERVTVAVFDTFLIETLGGINILFLSYFLFEVFANASPQLKLLPPFSTRVGVLAKAENICFADSDAPAIAAVDAADGGIITGLPEANSPSPPVTADEFESRGTSTVETTIAFT